MRSSHSFQVSCSHSSLLLLPGRRIQGFRIPINVVRRNRSGFPGSANSSPGRLICKCGGRETNTVEKIKGKVRVRVRLDHQVEFGQNVALFGSDKAIGEWKEGFPMTWTKNGWTAELEIAGGAVFEFKFVVLSGGGKTRFWEEGDNRVFEVPSNGVCDIVCKWNQTGESGNLVVADEDNYGSLVSEEEEEEDEDGGSMDVLEQSSFVENWQGKSVSFMRSNEHRSRESERRWSTEGLEGVPLKLVESDRDARNWWRKVLSLGLRLKPSYKHKSAKLKFIYLSQIVNFH